MSRIHALALPLLLLGTLPASAEDFFTAAEMRPMLPGLIESATRRLEADVIFPPGQAGHPLGQLDPMAMGVALVHRNLPEAAHVRYRVRLYRDPERPHDDFIEVLRVNHGPRVHAELVDTLGIEHVGPGPGHHPAHARWRLHLGNLRGMPLVYGAASASLSDGALGDAQCLGLPCLAEAPVQESPMLQDADWRTWTPPDDVGALNVPLQDAGDAPGPSGIEHPAQVAWKTARAFLGEGSWEPDEGTPGQWHQAALAEMVLDLQLHGQDDNQQATLCRFDLADDSVRDRCVAYRTVGMSGEFLQYTACVRGRSREGLCL